MTDMMPAKAPASSIFAKNLTSSLSSPVSLLWAHQLRREHSALLARVEDLASAVSKVSSAQLNKIAAQATRAEKKSIEIESKQLKLRNELDRDGENAIALEDELGRLSDKLEASEHSTLALQKDVRTIEERLKKDLLDRIATLERRLHNGQDEQERQVQELKAEIGELQNRLPDIVNEGVIGVKDSMEQIREQMNQIGPAKQFPNTSMMLNAHRSLAGGRPHPGRRETANEAPHASGLVQPNSEQTEDMLTLQPNLKRPDDSYLPANLDLDEDVFTPEPEGFGVGHTVPGETMAMLPQNPTSFHQNRHSPSLKQGKFQSWDRYVLAGESLKSMLPKRKEGAVVEAFVDGIYDEKVKQNCEKILDEAGWCWDGVKGFVENYIAVDIETQARQRTESLTHKHKRGAVCPVCPKKPNIAHHEDIAFAIADSPLRPALYQAVQLPLPADSRRRSQRILQQSQISSAAAINVTKPKPSKTRATKPTKEAQVVTQGPASQNTVPEKVKGKPTETGLGGAMLTRNRKGVMTPQYGKQYGNLDGFTKDRTTQNDTNTKSALPRNEKTTLQKTGPLPVANFELTMPMNLIINQNSLDLREEYVNTTTGARQVPQMQGSKKRKLVEQLEDPLVTKGDMVAQLDERVKQRKVNELERKKRRKKKAVVPIPMIPILPLSDDE